MSGEMRESLKIALYCCDNGDCGSCPYNDKANAQNCAGILGLAADALDKKTCGLTDSDGREISRCIMCGVELSPHELEEVETLRGEKYTIQVLECRKCGAPSFGWTRRERGRE